MKFTPEEIARLRKLPDVIDAANTLFAALDETVRLREALLRSWNYYHPVDDVRVCIHCAASAYLEREIKHANGCIITALKGGEE